MPSPHSAASRQRILDAARRHIAESDDGALPIRVVAELADVHRSTVYEYFAGREDLLVAVFVEEADRVFASVSRHFELVEFLPALVLAITDGIDAVRESPVLRRLLSPDGVGRLVSATSTSAAWHSSVRSSLHAPMSAAVARGEVRDDVPVDELLRWVVRIAISVTSEPPSDPPGTLTRFLVPALAAPP